MTDHEDLIRGYWERCWNGRELDHLGAVFHEPYVHNRSERTPRDHAEIITDTLASFPDLQVTIDDIRTTGDAVVTRCRFVGTHDGMAFGISATGRQIIAPTLDVFFISDGKVHRLWHLTDHLPIVRDIGATVRVGDQTATLD